MTRPVDGPHAPGALELVRQFVNTLDIESGTDQLSDAAGWSGWVDSLDVDLGRAEYAAPASDSDLEHARTVREALRVGLLANHDRGPLPASTAEALDAAARWATVRPSFTDTGVRLESTLAGVAALIADVLDATARALADGTWLRLKACIADDCHWAFYDHSRSRTGRWCSMGVCGNRAKQSRWRGKHDSRPRSRESSGMS